MPTTRNTLAPLAMLRAKFSKPKRYSSQFSIGPGSDHAVISPNSRNSQFEFEVNRGSIVAMKIATIIARVLLGLIFVVIGSNAFLHFIPMGAPPQGLAGEYFHAFAESGQVYVIGALQVIAGALLLIGRFVPLGLTILGAIIVNIWLFHIFLAPANFEPAILVTILELFLVWRYRDAFEPILSP